jgi:20S proteasome alpha/beta subunit
MTLLVGILCRDGVVIATDSAATYGNERTQTIGQQKVTKLFKLDTNPPILYCSTGAVGIGQMLSNSIENGWKANNFKNVKSPEEMMARLGQAICGQVQHYLQTGVFLQQSGMPPAASYCKSMIAMCVEREPCLFSFDFNGAPERATTDLSFLSLGSGQAIADPFLAFLKRILWSDGLLPLSEGRLVATWVMEHVKRTNPGGVGGNIQLATLDKATKSVTFASDEMTQEHMQKIDIAEKQLAESFRGVPKIDVPPPAPPEPPKQ